jgi:Protein of unknown function (DUF998)
VLPPKESDRRSELSPDVCGRCLRPDRAAGVFLTRPSRLNGARVSLKTLAAIASGTAGALLFTAVWAIEGVTRPGYNPWAQAISALSLGRGGWVQQINFVLFGVVVLVSALGWRQALAPGASSLAYPLLKGVEGVGLVIDGIFSQDPTTGYPPGTTITIPTLHGLLHVGFAVVTITAIAAGWFVLARRLRLEPDWRGWGRYALATGALNVVFIATFGALGSHGGVAGLFERLATLASLPLSLVLTGRLILQAWAARRTLYFVEI